MWVGVTLTVLVELVPSNIRTSAVAVYLFIISNVGGAMPLLVPPIQLALENTGYDRTDALRGQNSQLELIASSAILTSLNDALSTFLSQYMCMCVRTMVMNENLLVPM